MKVTALSTDSVVCWKNSAAEQARFPGEEIWKGGQMPRTHDLVL